MRSKASSSLLAGSSIFTSCSSSCSSTPSLPSSIRHSPILRFFTPPPSRANPQHLHPHLPFPRRHASTATPSPSPDRIIRPLVPPPREGSGPLLSRRPDRALPDISSTSIWLKTLPVFVLLVGLSSLAIFNYQKSSSSTINSILYALRTNPHAREILGDEIYFASKVPWIRGELSPLQGTIDITFWVKGNKATAQTKFVSIRKRGSEFFETLEWSLTTQDGKTIQLLQMEGTRDPISGQKL
ncbi:cytochrome oxidase assembly protein 1 [Exophiala xenobiotica]|uniref:Cytochrome oxidase assembly protein 1 n=1 Tax=Vermiconidia calcicola TaxID=1690605 RepID=A0AAV9QAT9_9PEZI|nr:cytochrome oxidase assembly protein 1 [Exophiala xenobiotica]KAK5538580.1 cytochrome oxidase assembly protein 1 [Vermiconidia calcicola]KAK5547931.1 cytochrome oxidase assembly protein 1 [Chaetothyriales sp. CCFEE 6169]KAK5222062.1 cytochrome oxidase assembly protein 1 [Exophiala xenobiotica]KAK5235621.1 cytochrome oxidase assembly protein 1 [Exophiala xenobiotica]